MVSGLVDGFFKLSGTVSAKPESNSKVSIFASLGTILVVSAFKPFTFTVTISFSPTATVISACCEYAWLIGVTLSEGSNWIPPDIAEYVILVNDGVEMFAEPTSDISSSITVSYVYIAILVVFANASAFGSSSNTPAELNGSGLSNINLGVSFVADIFFLENIILLPSSTVSVAPQENANLWINSLTGNSGNGTFILSFSNSFNRHLSIGMSEKGNNWFIISLIVLGPI